jgi:tetratricopeptide (TPR) repeat protein
MSNIKITTGSETIKVLVDESRVIEQDEVYRDVLVEQFYWPEKSDWSESFDNHEEYWGFGNSAKKIQEVASLDIRKKGSLSYKTLSKYDVLIIASFDEGYSSEEADAIKKFVENGGGLLLLADSEYPNNSVSRPFDVLFYSEDVAIGSEEETGRRTFTVKMTSKYIITLSVPKKYLFDVDDIKSHPITRGVDKITLYRGIPISSYKSGSVLARTSAKTWVDESGDDSGTKDKDEDEGPLDILLASEVGKGRAVFVGGARSFQNMVTEKEPHNMELLRNAVEWLGEPGGPYKQYKAVNEQAQQVLSDAVSLYEGHKFSEAIDRFEEAIGIFEESIEIYPNTEANDGIEEANNYIAQCETGIEADDIFDDAEDLYDKREYEKAIEEYERAKTLYDEIEYTERAQECTTKVDESNAWIALREEATQLFSDGEDALVAAPSTFDPTGYQNARSIFENAKSKWEEYDDPAQVTACEEKIQLCDDEIANIEKTRMMVIVVVVVVVIGVVVVVVIVIRKRKPKVTAAGEEVPPTHEVPPSEPEALDALKERYAKGEITKEEYDKLKSVLEKT